MTLGTATAEPCVAPTKACYAETSNQATNESDENAYVDKIVLMLAKEAWLFDVMFRGALMSLLLMRCTAGLKSTAGRATCAFRDHGVAARAGLAV